MTLRKFGAGEVIGRVVRSDDGITVTSTAPVKRLQTEQDRQALEDENRADEDEER
jgi:hypothetical protein